VREKVLKMAFKKHPNRFKGKVPKPMVALPKAVWINKPSPNKSDSGYAKLLMEVSHFHGHIPDTDCLERG
jgi:hypothetical protein